MHIFTITVEEDEDNKKKRDKKLFLKNMLHFMHIKNQ